MCKHKHKVKISYIWCEDCQEEVGQHVYEDEVVTASFATAQYLKTLHPRSCWIMLKQEGLDEFWDFHHSSEDPEYIVLGDFREDFNFQNLNKALRLLSKGAKLIVMIPEIIDNSGGELELTVGAYGKMLEGAANVKAIYIGIKGHMIIPSMWIITPFPLPSSRNTIIIRIKL